METNVTEVLKLTYGQQAVGITFNPGGNPLVSEIKQKYADIIDILNTARAASTTTSEAKRHYSVAITDTEAAAMRAIKAVTFPY